MGMTIVVAGQKGGSGKSTTTVNLTSELLYLGYNVAVVDTDTKLGAFYWGERRLAFMDWLTTGELPENDFITEDRISILPKSVEKNCRMLLENGKFLMPDTYSFAEKTTVKNTLPSIINEHDITIIDTAGGDTQLNTYTCQFADLVLVPFKPSAFDMDTMPEVTDMFETLQNASFCQTIRSVCNEKSNNSNDYSAKEFAMMLKLYPILSEQVQGLSTYKAYKNCLNYGLGVREWDHSKARAEVSNLAANVESILKSL